MPVVQISELAILEHHDADHLPTWQVMFSLCATMCDLSHVCISTLSHHQGNRQNDVPGEDEQRCSPCLQAPGTTAKHGRHYGLTTVRPTSHHKHGQNLEQVQHHEPPGAPNGVVKEVHHKYPQLQQSHNEPSSETELFTVQYHISCRTVP